MIDVIQVFICVAAAAACAGLVRAVSLPLPLLQIAAGALLAWPGGLDVRLEPEAFLLIFVPPLLFIDGWHIPKQAFRRFRHTILLMAFGLVIITVLGVGTLIRWCVPTIPPAVAFALAAALSPTDAVAVAGIAGRTRLPPTLMHVLQGEALMNDASGLVCLRVALAAIATGAFSWSRAAGSLVWVALGGLAVGIGVTWLFARAQRLVFGRQEGDPGPRILLLLILPYAAYIAAEHWHLSGILAAAAAGMSLPRFELVDVGHRRARRQATVVVNMVELAMNGMVFVLLGLQLPNIFMHARATSAAAGFASAYGLLGVGAVVTFGLFVVRFGWVFMSMRTTLARKKRKGETAPPLSLRIVTATALAGVRGAISLAAALMIPLATEGGYPAREVAVFVTAVVILLSLVSAGMGLPAVVKDITMPLDAGHPDDEAPVRLAMLEAAVAAIEHERDERAMAAPDVRASIDAAANAVIESYRARAADGAEDGADPLSNHERGLRMTALHAERAYLHDLWRGQRIDDPLYRRLLAELDLEEEAAVPSGSVGHAHGH